MKMNWPTVIALIAVVMSAVNMFWMIHTSLIEHRINARLNFLGNELNELSREALKESSWMRPIRTGRYPWLRWEKGATVDFPNGAGGIKTWVLPKDLKLDVDTSPGSWEPEKR